MTNEYDMPPGYGPAPVPHEVWTFSPSTDIKVKELAEILAVFEMGFPPEFFEQKVPPHLRKHFESLSKHFGFLRKHLGFLKQHIEFLKNHIESLNNHLGSMRKHI